MRMANFALTILWMPRNVVFMAMMMLMATATFIVLMLFMLMVVLMATTTFIVLMLFMFMVVLMATATFIVLMLMMMTFMLSVIIATAAVIMLCLLMLMSMAAAISMAMLRYMPHAGVVMVLAAVTTGAAFGMLAIILSTLNMAVHMSKAAHLLGGITHFF